MILNNDTVLADSFLSELVRLISSFITMDVLCPVVKDSNGKIIYSGGYLSLSGPVHETWKKSLTTKTGFAYGCCIVFTSKAFNDLRFDKNYFMYYEDADLTLRAKKKGYDIWVSGVLEVIHDKKIEIDPRPWVRYYQSRNILYMNRNNNDEFWKFVLYYYAYFIPKRLVYFTLKGNFKTVWYILKGIKDYYLKRMGKMK